MDKVASDMFSFLNRTLQKTEKAFKITEKAIADPVVEHLTTECNKLKRGADNLVSIIQSVIQPSIDDMVQERLDTKKEILNDAEQLGDEMVRIGTELGDDTYGTLLMRCGEAERAIGKAVLDRQRRVEDGYLGALRSYSNNCAKSSLKECEKQEESRLDLDRAKTLPQRFKDDAIKEQEKLRDSLIEFMKDEREYYEQCLRAVNDALK